MGQLNSLIKFLVINANGFLALGGLGTVVVAANVLASNFINLSEVRNLTVYSVRIRKGGETFC